MTEARGCTEAEATAARAKAMSLMERHGVSFEELAQPSETTTAPECPVSDSDKRAGYRDWFVHSAHSSDEFLREVLARDSRRRWRARVDSIARKIAGSALVCIAGLVVLDAVRHANTDFDPKFRPPRVSTAELVSDISALSPARPEPSSSPSAASTPQGNFQGVYQRLYKGWWVKFELGQDGKVVGTPICSSTRWLRVPVWND